MYRGIISASVALVLLVLHSPAHAAEAPRSEVLELAHEATFDDDALERLKDIDSIDGRPVDMERLVAGARGTDIEDRVAALVSETPPSTATGRDPAADRAEAEQILEQERYRPQEIPRPFRGPLEWIADRLEPVGNAVDAFFGWVADLFGRIADGTPGGAATLWLFIGVAVVTIVAAQTKKVIGRRGRSRTAEATSRAALRGEDPRDLERRAAEARERGDHDLEVRFLFRAGVLRLARARAIPSRRSVTTGEIRRLLSSDEFDRLGRSFDEIAYGRRPASGADGDDARSGWSRVLQKVER